MAKPPRPHQPSVPGSAKRADAEAHFEQKVLPSLRYVRRVGGTYTASTFWALLGLLQSKPDLAPGDPIGMPGTARPRTSARAYSGFTVVQTHARPSSILAR